MWVLMLEAGIALLLLVFIVWWTMFSGKGPNRSSQEKTSPPKDDPTHQ
jgi:hypothetical protein